MSGYLGLKERQAQDMVAGYYRKELKTRPSLMREEVTDDGVVDKVAEYYFKVLAAESTRNI
ncbi:hypothetical protein HDU96_006705 [Phlyctochytrium bullatum]|nr:hypothetical protein HDU96_006705 [Phlyctochytrium bullatum]